MSSLWTNSTQRQHDASDDLSFVNQALSPYLYMGHNGQTWYRFTCQICNSFGKELVQSSKKNKLIYDPHIVLQSSLISYSVLFRSLCAYLLRVELETTHASIFYLCLQQSAQEQLLIIHLPGKEILTVFRTI